MPDIVSNAELLVALGKTSAITAAHQSLLTLFHQLAESAVRAHLQYDPTYQQHVELYPVQSFRQASSILQLRHMPVRRVTEIVVDENAYGGQAPDAFTAGNGAEVLTAGVDYFVKFSILPATIGGQNGLSASDGFCKSAMVQGISRRWPCEPGSVRVTYTAGYTENELRGQGSYHTAGQIKKATIDTLVANFKELIAQAKQVASSRAGSFVSENFGDYSYSLDAASLAMTSFAMTIPASAHQNLQDHRNIGVLGM